MTDVNGIIIIVSFCLFVCLLLSDVNLKPNPSDLDRQCVRVFVCVCACLFVCVSVRSRKRERGELDRNGKVIKSERQIARTCVLLFVCVCVCVRERESVCASFSVLCVN